MLPAILSRCGALRASYAVETHLDAINRRGRPIRCRVTTKLINPGREIIGVILVMEPMDVGGP